MSTWQTELDLMNTDTQDVFGVDITLERVLKGDIDLDTGAVTETLVGSVTVKAIRREPRSIPFSPGGGSQQHVTEIVYEILTSDLDHSQTGDTPPYGPVRKGDIIKDPDLDRYTATSGDSVEQKLSVSNVERSVDQRFWIVTARGSLTGGA